MGGTSGAKSVGVNAVNILASVPPDELSRFKITGRHAGKVIRAGDNLKTDTGAVVLRRTGWMLESRWKPPPKRKRFKATMRRIFRWRSPWRRSKLYRECSSRKLGINDDDLYDDECNSWEEDGIPDVYSEHDLGTDGSDSSVNHASPGKQSAQDLSQHHKNKYQADGDAPHTVDVFPRQFSLDFSEQQDERSLRTLPKRNKDAHRACNLPRGVPLKPVNKHKGGRDISFVSMEHLTESSGSSSANSSDYQRKSEGKSYSKSLDPHTTPPKIHDVLEHETSPVSSIRGSDVSPSSADVHRTSSSLTPWEESSLMRQSPWKVSFLHLNCPREFSSSLERDTCSDKAARKVSLYKDEFISFSCDSRQQKGVFKLKSRHENSRSACKAHRQENVASQSGILRRLLGKSDG